MIDSVLAKVYSALDELGKATDEFFSYAEELPVGLSENDNVQLTQKSLDDAKDSLNDAIDSLHEFSDELEYED